MSTTRLSTTCTATVGPATLVGRIWRVSPLPLWSGDATTEATTYRTRNPSTKTRDVQTWLAVRFAQPPVGARRYKEAVDYDYPAGTYQCDKFGAVPHQSYDIEGSDIGRPEWGNGISAANPRMRDGSPEDEDCLFLNIYRPSGTPPAGGWPVIFWIHGGGHTYRSNTEPHERGHRLATEGLIIVSVGYRLGDFGFWHHARLEEEPDWNGPNLAYSDIKSGLRWVSRNIAAFGGDPTRVVIGGSSAGAVETLALMEDPSVQSLFSASWISSGGGIGARMSKTMTPQGLGYAWRYDNFHRSVRAMDGHLRDYSNPSRTMEQAFIAAGVGGEGNAMRLGLSPDLILSFAGARDRLRFPNWNMGTVTTAATGSENIYPFIGNGITYERAILAADAGKFTKPFVNVTSENEANMQPDYASWGEGETGNWLKLLRVPNYQEWVRESWLPANWDNTERRRQAYMHSIWHWPAWRIVRQTVMTGAQARAYLVFWGFGANAANHTTDVTYLFGNLEWNAGMDGTQARVTERMVRMSVGVQRLLKNLAYNGQPNTNAPASAQSFSLYATPPNFVLAAYSNTWANNWNIVGSTEKLGGGTAPVQITHEPYLPGAWAYYNGTFDEVGSAVIDTPPAITTAATISGTGTVGQTLTVSIGAASGNPAPTSSIQWRRGSTNISGATGTTYTLVSADGGQTITARVTWANYMGTAVSSPSINVASVTNQPPPGEDWLTYGDGPTDFITDGVENITVNA